MSLSSLYAMEREEAIALLRRDYSLFTEIIDEFIAANPPPPIAETDDSLVANTARALRENGVAILRGYVTDQSLRAKGCAYSRLARERADLFDVGPEDKLDPDLQGLLWRRQMARANTRISFNARQVPTIFAPLVEDGFFGQVFALASGVQHPVPPTLLVIDNLQPTREHEFQWWHFDRLSDQFKVMVLLDKVDEDTGPMKIISGTHRFDKRSRILDFAFYANNGNGYDGDLGFPLIESLRHDQLLCTGEPGDIVLFDTRAYHCHGRPDQGERLTSTLYFQRPPTPLNLFFEDFRRADQVV